MTPEESLLQAIIENPDDDTPRLAFADWLAAHGNIERAEFIRIQCVAAKLVEDHPERARWEARAGELVNDYKTEWAGSLLQWVWGFHRGFIDDIYIQLEEFASHADHIFASAPVRHVRFSTAQFQLGRPSLVHLSAASDVCKCH